MQKAALISARWQIAEIFHLGVIVEEMCGPVGKNIALIGDGGHLAIEVVSEKEGFIGFLFDQ
jgi:hypothetical protein